MSRWEARSGAYGPDLTSAGRVVASVTAILCVGAGIVHVSAAADHENLPLMMGGFLAVAALQVALGGLLLWRRPSGLLLVAALGLMLGSVGMWLMSRTMGLPFLPGGHIEPIGFKDGVTVLFELASVPGLLLLMSRELQGVRLPTPRLGAQAIAGIGSAAFLLFVPALMLGGGEHHSHDQAVAIGIHSEDGHGHGGEELASADGADGHEHGDVPGEAGGAGSASGGGGGHGEHGDHGDHGGGAAAGLAQTGSSAGGAHDHSAGSGGESGGSGGDSGGSGDHADGHDHGGGDRRGSKRKSGAREGHDHGKEGNSGDTHDHAGGEQDHGDHGGSEQPDNGPPGPDDGGTIAWGRHRLDYEPAEEGKNGEPGTGYTFSWKGPADASQGGHPHSSGACNPTPAQEAAADRLYRATKRELAKYANNPGQAFADGFSWFFGPTDRIVHMLNPDRVYDPTVVDPDEIESFLYAMTDRGWMPIGGMYIMPKARMAGPAIGGCRTQWHHHGALVETLSSAGTSRDGETREMLHVWTYPGLKPYGHYDGRSISQLWTPTRFVPNLCRHFGDASDTCL
jgi:hypothetical protein